MGAKHSKKSGTLRKNNNNNSTNNDNNNNNIENTAIATNHKTPYRFHLQPNSIERIMFECDNISSIKSNIINNNKKLTSDFPEIEKSENIYCDGSELLYFTKNYKAYSIKPSTPKSSLLNDKQENIKNIIIGFGQKYILTTKKVYLSNGTVNLPEIENDDEIIKLCTSGCNKFAFLFTAKGNIYIYGENVNGVLGIGNNYTTSTFTEFTKLTTIVEDLPNKIIDLKCGYLFAILRCENGDCYGTGYNYYNNIGIEGPNSGELKVFTLIEKLKGRVKQYDCGFFHSAYLTFDGEVYICGKQDDGQLVDLTQLVL
ncbi:hypothetical protein ABK040_006346 [Willaertia magna]